MFTLACNLEPTLEAIANAGVGKTKQTFALNMLTGWNAGAWIAVGALLATITYAHFSTFDTGVATFMFAAVFPIGLIGIIFMGGADLFTGDCSITPFAGMTKKATWAGMLRNWVCALSGNFIGSVCFAWIVAFAYLYGAGTAATKAVAVASGKVAWGSGLFNWDYLRWAATYIFKGIVCNFLVNWAIWQAFKSNQNLMAKVVNIWFPIMAFVAVGSEHLIANMFFIPVGIFYGAGVTWSQAFIINFAPVLIGNMIGGYVFIGLNYWFSSGAQHIDDDPNESRNDLRGLGRMIKFLGPLFIGMGVLLGAFILIPGLIAFALELGVVPGSGVITFMTMGYTAMESIVIPLILIAYFIVMTMGLRILLRKLDKK